MPEIEAVKNELVLTIATGKASLKRNEDKILELLANSKGNILDDVDLI
jgi:dynein heavy chain